jgi:competence protein ComEC
VIPAATGWIAVAILVGVPSALLPAAIAAWAASVFAIATAVVLVMGRWIPATVSITLIVAALLLTSAATTNAVQNPKFLLDAAKFHRFATFTASLDVDTRLDAARSPIPVSILAATVGQESFTTAAIPALVFGSVPQAGIGSTIRITGTIVSAEPGDRERFLVFARGSPAVVAPPPPAIDWANELRLQFHRETTALPGDGGALLPGLAIGDTSAVSPTLDAAMKSTSLSHLTAVSGANCAVVVGLVMLVAGAAGANRITRITVSLAVLAGFVILVTPSASVLRAAVMAALVLGSLSTGRPTRGVPILSLAIVVLLASDPWLSRDVGFLLSVLATAGLLVLAGPLAKRLARWLPSPIAAVISIPLAAQLACQPVLILLNPSIPVYGVLANLLSEPAAPIATVLGLLGCAIAPILEPAGRVATDIAWLPSAWIAAVARFFSHAPGAQAPWLPGAVGVLALVVVTAFFVAALVRPPSRSRRIISGSLAVIMIAYFAVLLGTSWGHRIAVPDTWQIAACDIGQGDAVIVRSLGAIALIDTGPKPARLAACLDELGIHHIDLLVLSHYDLDHVGGTSAVLGIVDRAIVGPVSDASDTELRTALAESGAEVDEVARGAEGILGELRWRVLWPPARLGTIEPGNPASVTVRFEGVGACAEGCLSSIFLGDLGEDAQSRLLGLVHPEPVDIVKVAHHGSADQCERLYERLNARVGIIGVGTGNTYGHPTDELLNILNRVGTRITRTDLEGMILLSPAAGGGVLVWTERSPTRDVGAH